MRIINMKLFLNKINSDESHDARSNRLTSPVVLLKSLAVMIVGGLCFDAIIVINIGPC